jgi:hypothetical protein
VTDTIWVSLSGAEVSKTQSISDREFARPLKAHLLCLSLVKVLQSVTAGKLQQTLLLAATYTVPATVQSQRPKMPCVTLLPQHAGS